MIDPERLLELEAACRGLEPDAKARAEHAAAVRGYVETWLQRLPDKPVYMADAGPHPASNLTISETPAAMDTVLKTLATEVDSSGQNLGHSRFMAYIPSGGLHAGALGDYLAAAVNRYTAVDYAAPGAARLECELVSWLAREVGMPESTRGDLTSGGSIATLSAINAARARHDLRARDVENTVVYHTALTHHCFTKALQVAGLAECVHRQIPLDARYRMDVAALDAAVRGDREAGLRPWLIAATAGTTDLGTIDPLPELADLATLQGLWLHVDAAYGGAFVLSETGRQRLAGLDRADSTVINPHKGLFLPTGLGIVLVRDGERLFDAFHARGSYMQDVRHVDGAYSACDFSPELTRPFRGLRLWLALKLAGVAAFRAALEEKLLLAEYAWERIRDMDGFEVGPQPDLSIVTFRYQPRNVDANRFNQALFEAIRDDGRIFLSTTTVDGVFTLRLAVLGYNTHKRDVDVALGVIEAQANRLRG